MLINQTIVYTGTTDPTSYILTFNTFTNQWIASDITSYGMPWIIMGVLLFIAFLIGILMGVNSNYR